MSKKRVIATFSFLLVFALVLFSVQQVNKTKLTGLGINQDLGGDYVDNSYSIAIQSYSIMDNTLKVYYSAQDIAGKKHDIRITYFIHDASGAISQQGEDKVILDAGKRMDYTLSFLLTNQIPEEAFITLVANDGFHESRAIMPIVSGKNSITGSAIGDYRATVASYFLVILLALFVLFYCIKAWHYHKIRKEVRKHLNHQRFIPVHRR